ncbi:MAG TPA: sugar ABC transporter substrate-binding protein [Gaiellaceae bacterium]|nr:sugar ABC transporter substrate-binding protein [Gaiellaceae bacterium]
MILPALAVLIVAGVTVTGAAAAPQTTYKIALSNSFIGNKWRIEMENLFKGACKMPPYTTTVSCSVYNSGNDVSKQTQQISNLISQGVNSIVIDAASPTGLNGIIGQACARHILVVSYDNTVTAPCALQVNTDQFAFGAELAQAIATDLHGKGNVIMVTGVAGTYADDQRNKGADSVWKKYPGIKIVARYTGMWDSSTAERNTAAQLPSLPHIDGIWCQGGTDGVLKAFIAAKRTPLPVTAGEAENGFRKFMLPQGYLGQHVTGLSLGQPPFLVLAALELAREVLSGTHAKKSVNLPYPAVTQKTVKDGVTVFPKLADSFFDDFTDSGPKATVQICVQAALTGAACPGRLLVRLPK